MPTRLLVLSEDSGAAGQRVVLRMLLHAALCINPRVNTETLRAHVDLADQEGAFRAARRNMWKARPRRLGSSQATNDLRVAILESLLDDNTTWILLWHVDGDRPWSERGSSENVSKLHDWREMLQSRLESAGVSQPEAEALLRRLVVICPFYSIEAWLYQNTSEARRIIAENPGLTSALPLFQAWENEPQALDDVPAPKKHCALADEFNLRLANKAWPRTRAYDADRSFRGACQRLLECPEFLEILAALEK